MRSFDEILAKIAHDNGTTPEDVLHEMQVAIDDAYDHHDQEAQQLWDRMTFKGDRPTPEEFIFQVAPATAGELSSILLGGGFHSIKHRNQSD